MTIAEAITLFMQSRLGVIAPPTVKKYQATFALLSRFGAERGLHSISDFTLLELRTFRAQLAERTERHANNPHREKLAGGLSPATINKELTNLRTFFRFLFTEGLLPSNPAQKLKFVPQPTRPPKAITDNDLALLLRTALNNPNVIFGVRDYAFLRFLAETGCRIGGMLGLTLGTLDLVKGRALVYEKGGKSRYVYFSPDTSAALVRYLGYHPSARLVGWQITVTDPSAKLWRGHQGDWTASAVNTTLRRLAKRAGIQGKFNAHSFRHRFALNYLDNGGDLASLSQLMGHGDVRITEQSYAQFGGDALQEKHDQFITLPDVAEAVDLPQKPKLRVVRRKKRPARPNHRKAAGGDA